MPRVEIPFIGPSYTNREKPLSAQVSKNLWPEINPEARNKVSLHNTAGIRTLANLDGIDRGMHDFNNLLYVVNGGYLYTVDDEGTSNQIGAITGTNRCVMANDPTQLIIVTGSTPYRYTVASGLEVITDENLVNPTSVAYLNSQFIFDNNNGTFGEFVTSSIQAGLSIDALDFATAESHPDDIVRVIAYRQLVYFFGTHSVEPWRNTGTGNPPFARQDSGIRTYGLAGTHAITTTDEFIYYLDNRRIPRRSNGLDHPPIGNPTTGVEFAKYSKIDDCVVFDFVQDNQQFVVYTFPTANRSWAYHELSNSWFQLTSGVHDDRHRASSMINIYGLNYCADHTNGKLYEYSLDILTDDGDPIIKLRDTAPIHGGLYEVPGKQLYLSNIEFVIASGRTEVAGLGLGAQPVTADVGLCGTSADLTQGQLLGVGQTPFMNNDLSQLAYGASATDNSTFADTKIISFTCAFTKQYVPTGTGAIVHAIDLYSVNRAVTNFGFHMDTDGYMHITARNVAGTEILNVQITNNGASFADSKFYMFSVVINLADSTKREIYINNIERGATTWTTWTTYTDDTINLEDIATTNEMTYSFGKSQSTGFGWADPDTDSGNSFQPVGTETLGFVTLDDSCSLIASSVWDNTGKIRDPQAWEGWYKTQPQVAYLPSFWMNSGKTAPTAVTGAGSNGSEKLWSSATSATIYNGNHSSTRIDASEYNFGVGSTLTATDKDTLPDAPAPVTPVELVAPFWENTGTFIDLSKLTQTTFQAMFGVTVEGADFAKDVTVNKAALVNTSNTGNRIQLRNSTIYANGYIAIVDSTGVIIDSSIYDGAANSDSLLIPTTGDHYVVVTSDATQAKVKKWDSIVASTVGSVTYESVFVSSLGDRASQTETVFLQEGGITITLVIPNTTAAKLLSFTSPSITSNNFRKSGSISDTVGDYSAAININSTNGVFGGINHAGTPKDLIPGNTYFFNMRFDNRQTGYAHIQVNYVDAP